MFLTDITRETITLKQSETKTTKKWLQLILQSVMVHVIQGKNYHWDNNYH